MTADHSRPLEQLTAQIATLKAGYKRATIVFYTSLALSMGANFVSGYIPGDDHETLQIDPLLAGTLALLWPLALLAAEVLLTQIPKLSNPVLDRSVRWLALTVGIIAFAGSAQHIMTVARLIPGTEPWMAWTAPVLIDLVMLMAAVISVDLKRKIYDLETELAVLDSVPAPAPEPVQPVPAPAPEPIAEAEPVVEPEPVRQPKPTAKPKTSRSDRHDSIVAFLHDAPATQAELVAWIMAEHDIASKRTAERDLAMLRDAGRVHSHDGLYSPTVSLQEVS